MKHIYTIMLVVTGFGAYGQISFSAIGTPYTQNFNSLPTTSDAGTITWTDNTSLAGFYVLPASILFESSYTTISNTGKPYIYKSGTDLSIGSRASGSSPNNNIYIGARFKNNTGAIIKSLEVSYYGEQWSIAENGSNVNTMQFHYQKSASAITSLNSGSWTAVTALSFQQIWTSAQSAAKGGTACSGTSNQCLALDGNNAANRVLKYAVFNVTVNPGEEVMLRWYDRDDSSNDHHMQIDELEVIPWDQPANIVLPINLAFFNGHCEGQNLVFSWSTYSERDNAYFTVESTEDNISFEASGTVKGAGNSDVMLDYELKINQASGSYFRLKQTDYNGKSMYSELFYLACSDERKIQLYPNPNKGSFFIENVPEGNVVRVYNELGQLLITLHGDGQVSSLARGLYFVESAGSVQKVVVN
ncbi:MAG: T9SS type A sorting domain-containing protein [Bacteroidota bacterium]